MDREALLGVRVQTPLKTAVSEFLFPLVSPSRRKFTYYYDNGKKYPKTLDAEIEANITGRKGHGKEVWGSRESASPVRSPGRGVDARHDGHHPQSWD